MTTSPVASPLSWWDRARLAAARETFLQLYHGATDLDKALLAAIRAAEAVPNYLPHPPGPERYNSLGEPVVSAHKGDEAAQGGSDLGNGPGDRQPEIVGEAQEAG